MENAKKDAVYYSTLWVVFCSNAERSVAECIEKTKTFLAEAPKELVTMIENNVNTAYRNRGYDNEFLKAMFELEDSGIANACVRSMLDADISIADRVEAVMPYIDKYIERFGETEDIKLTKMRLLVIPAYYLEHKEDVETLLATL